VYNVDRVRLRPPHAACRQLPLPVPWLFDEEAVDVLRTFTRLKMG